MKAHIYESNPVDENGYVDWSETENNTWATLVARQAQAIEGKASAEFMRGLEILDFPKDKVPQLPDINKKLEQCTGWGVQAVPAIIQPKEFFNLLANKRFPAATFMRIPEHMDYLQEPDIFHELYGHTPLLTNEAYANFMQKFGQLALEAEPKDRRRLFRLFWFTIEFGLVKTDDGLRAYGGGILSSIGETQYFVTDDNEKEPFNTLNILRTPYRIDIMQPLYFVLESFNDLFNILEEDVLGLLEQSKQLGDFPAKYPPKESEQSIEQQSDSNNPMRC